MPVVFDVNQGIILHIIFCCLCLYRAIIFSTHKIEVYHGKLTYLSFIKYAPYLSSVIYKCIMVLQHTWPSEALLYLDLQIKSTCLCPVELNEPYK